MLCQRMWVNELERSINFANHTNPTLHIGYMGQYSIQIWDASRVHDLIMVREVY